MLYPGGASRVSGTWVTFGGQITDEILSLTSSLKPSYSSATLLSSASLSPATDSAVSDSPARCQYRCFTTALNNIATVSITEPTDRLRCACQTQDSAQHSHAFQSGDHYQDFLGWKLEYVDVVFANRPDPNTPMEGGGVRSPAAGCSELICSLLEALHAQLAFSKILNEPHWPRRDLTGCRGARPINRRQAILCMTIALRVPWENCSRLSQRLASLKKDVTERLEGLAEVWLSALATDAPVVCMVEGSRENKLSDTAGRAEAAALPTPCPCPQPPPPPTPQSPPLPPSCPSPMEMSFHSQM
ncbi:hypothetical protein JZ751_028363 [Albula glossodonta]|uniref:Uncharacterized protein n=1 Tax=Albula glossodonta TaxID=121402 RepID=A0A8T2NB77_9TELE|nr:hypothetical protein JZ751_028363 [Albula glossodonta]